MNYDIKIFPKEKYLNVKVTGRDSLEATKAIWAKIVKESFNHDCQKILLESDLENEKGENFKFDYIVIFNEVGLTKYHKVACVDLSKNNIEDYKKIQNHLNNNGFEQIKLFDSVLKAKQWLL